MKDIIVSKLKKELKMLLDLKNEQTRVNDFLDGQIYGVQKSIKIIENEDVK